MRAMVDLDVMQDHPGRTATGGGQGAKDKFMTSLFRC